MEQRDGAEGRGRDGAEAGGKGQETLSVYE